MCLLSGKYKNLLGIPNEGVHRYRVFNFGNFEGFAIADILMTIISAFVIMWFFTTRTLFKFLFILLILFIFAEICHYIFCVDTAFMRLLNGPGY